MESFPARLSRNDRGKGDMTFPGKRTAQRRLATGPSGAWRLRVAAL